MAAREVTIGVFVGLLLGAGGLYAAEHLVLEPQAPCGGRCGEGTRCEADRCLAEATEDEPEVAEVAEDGGRRRKDGRRRGGRRGDSGDAPAPTRGPAIDDDSKVPRFDPRADETIGMDDGTGRLTDAQVDAELAKLDPAFRKCVEQASERVDELGAGTVKLSFGVDGSGKVTGVNARAPKQLADAGLVPCVRLAVHGHRFPRFDGPTMKVTSSFTVE